MSQDLDLSDPAIRAMAERDHAPFEQWGMGSGLIGVYCEACVQTWPCTTVERLRNLRTCSVEAPAPLQKRSLLAGLTKRRCQLLHGHEGEHEDRLGGWWA